MIKGGAISKDCSTVPQAMMKIAVGKDMGLTPAQSLNMLYIVNGQVQAWGKGLSYLLRKAGWRYTFEDRADSCTITITKGDESYSDTATFENAKKSGYTESSYNGRSFLKVGWKDGQNRLLKLRYMAMSMVIKSYVPEILGGAMDIVEIAEDVDLDAPIKEIKAEETQAFVEKENEQRKAEDEAVEAEIVAEVEDQEIDENVLGAVHRRYIEYCGQEQSMDYDEAVELIETQLGEKFKNLTGQQITEFVKNTFDKKSA